MDFFLCFGLFSTYVHGKPSLGLPYRKIGYGGHVSGFLRKHRFGASEYLQTEHWTLACLCKYGVMFKDPKTTSQVWPLRRWHIRCHLLRRFHTLIITEKLPVSEERSGSCNEPNMFCHEIWPNQTPTYRNVHRATSIRRISRGGGDDPVPVGHIM